MGSDLSIAVEQIGYLYLFQMISDRTLIDTK